MIQIRPHVYDYEQSMSRAVYVKDVDDLLAYIRCMFPEKCAALGDLAQRHFGRDRRNGWDSWLITVRSSPLVWADAPVSGVRQLEPIHLPARGPVVAHHHQ
jgi:hypothetical protein